MKKGSKYQEFIRALPLESGADNLAQRLIIESGILDQSAANQVKTYTALPQRVPPIIACLALVLALFTYTSGWFNPQPLVSERLGINAVALWDQAADGFRSTLEN